jgi:Zn-dependent M28 family amino/carboxypeptidase
LERQIDEEKKPHSMTLRGWSVAGNVEVRRHVLEAKNVVAVMEGAGALADETIVFGAHYDVLPELSEAPLPSRAPHDYPTFLGDSCDGALMGTSAQAICQGANDNASGVAVMLEVARGMAKLKQKPRRRLVFIAFAGEELGMVGSKSYIRQPLFPIEKTVAMVNLDMVGRLASDKLVAIGAAPPGRFSKLLDQINQRHGFQIDKTGVHPWSGDQAPFHAKRIPTIYFATGPDETINTSADRPQRLNIGGMQRIARFLTEFLMAVAVDHEAGEYAKPTK